MKSIIRFIQSSRFQQIAFAGTAFFLAASALFNPFFNATGIEDIGGLLLWAALLVFIQGFKRSTVAERNSAHISALITLLLGILLVNVSLFESSAVYLFAAILFGADTVRQFVAFSRRKKSNLSYTPQLLFFIGNLGTLLVLFFLRGRAAAWGLSVAGALRIAGMGFEILSARIGELKEVGEDVVASLKLQDHPEIAVIVNGIEEKEAARAPIDRRWMITLLIILFCMHLGRMGFDRSSIGILSPLVALVGDIVIALIISYGVLVPILSNFKKILNPFEKKLWLWVMERPAAERRYFSLRTLVQSRLESRTRGKIRIRRAGYSFKKAIGSGLQIGLPYSALLAAVIPVFGMSWYFDTENWASGIWDSWAAKRTDDWRVAMVQAVEAKPAAGSFMLRPAGVTDTGAFSFLVIGDPGEGDASQYVLSSEIVNNASKEAVKFLVISSDVIYPDGAMKDYEKKFWLPMKGIHKPVYAIPGNHDWYDALEGFAATFYDSANAYKAMKARRAVDLNLTSATVEKIGAKIDEAARLRREYDVPTGFQQAPYFQVQTKDFAFICVETGVSRRIDAVQMDWLKKALQASQGKFIFVLLGHPFYAIGEYQGDMNPDFAAIHQLLRDNGVTIAMAGDTHDLEYYLEPLKGKDTGKVMHHFVNGGGGAYLSLGAALKPPDQMAVKVWAHYPASAPLINKIESNIGRLKRPAWIWTKKYNGWPFSAEWLSAAFDYNKSPFFQSFMEIQVDPAKNKVRLIAHGIRGELKWSEMEYSKGVKPAGVSADASVKWEFTLK